MQLDNEQELENYLIKPENFEQHFSQAKCFRQFNLNKYGIIDILSVRCTCPYINKNNKGEIEIDIIELKKKTIDIKALIQISVYKKGIQKLLQEIDLKTIYKKFHIFINGTIIGANINEETNFIFLLEQISWLNIYTYHFDMNNGISFTSQTDGDWIKTNNKFNGKNINKIKKELFKIPTEHILK